MNRTHSKRFDTDFTPAPDIHGFTMDDEILLFQAGASRMFRLNPTATAIWQGISADVPVMEIARILAQATGGRHEAIIEDIRKLVQQWQQMGLVARPGDPPFDAVAPNAPEDSYIELEAGETILPMVPKDPSLGFRLIDTDFHLQLPSTHIYHLVHPLLSHLNVDRPAADAIRFRVVRTTMRYLLLKGDDPIDWCPHENGITPMVHANGLMTAYDYSDHLIGVHSAAVAVNGRNLLFPALSGSGKSTLTAAMVGSGYPYLADDLVLLTDAPILMRPVPVAIGVKSGSWDLLAPYLPELPDIPVHLRADEKEVRYYVPVNADGSGFAPRPVHAVVFPKYARNSALSLTAIKPAEALCRIADAGYDSRRDLTVDVVDQLVRWIGRTPCYELRYDRLPEAMDALGAMDI